MVPVIIITGFLGSGKTSLIAQQLDSDESDGISVLVHDLGEENLDVSFLQGGEHVSLASNDQIRSVASGHLSENHEAELIRGLDELAAKQPKPSAIFIEFSGAADIIGFVKQLSGKTGAWELISVVSVLDASLLRYYLDDAHIAPLVRRQANAASLLVLNKWDRASLSERRAAKKFAKEITAQDSAELLKTKFGSIPRDVLMQRRRIAEIGNVRDDAEQSPIESVHIKERRPFHPQRLEAWLSQAWPGILRVKGYVWLATDMEGIYVVDAAGPQREVGLEGTWYAAVAAEELPDDEEVQALVSQHKWGDRRQALTVIGNPDAVNLMNSTLQAALLSDEEMELGPEGWKTLPDPLTGKFH